MIDWNRDGKIDASEMAFTAYLMQMEQADGDDDEPDAQDDMRRQEGK